MQLKQQTTGHNISFLGVTFSSNSFWYHLARFCRRFFQFSVKCRIAMAHAFLYHSAPSPNSVVSRGQTLPRGRVWPRETRPEVLKHPSSAVIAFFAVLKVKYPSSDVVAFYEGRGDTIHYANMGPAQDSSYTGVQYSLGNLVWGYNNSGYQIHHDWLFQKQCGGRGGLLVAVHLFLQLSC